MFLKRLTEWIVTMLGFLLIGVGFMVFSSVSYVPRGTVGTADMMSTIVSVCYIAAIPLLFSLLGRAHRLGAYAALVMVFVYFMGAGALGYLGYAQRLQSLIYPFYIIVAPFAPLIESLIDTFSLATLGMYLMLLIPMVIYGLSMLSYIVAHGAKNRRVIERGREKILVSGGEQDE